MKMYGFEHRGGMTEEHKQALRKPKRIGHTDERKAQNAEMVRQQWADGTRKPFGPMSEEEKAKRRKKAAEINFHHDDETIERIRAGNSHTYVITLTDGTSFIIRGLKRYAAEIGVPYVTLSKAAQAGTAVKKYGILSVCKLEDELIK